MALPRRLPWSDRDVPHALLDLGRACDCVCRACYNRSKEGFRSLDALAADLAALRRARRLHTITLAGGEPLLHPQLPAVVRLVKAQVPRCAMLSNGQRLDDDACRTLAAAGLDAVFLHIDAGQRRGDLPDGHDGEARDALRRTLARRCRVHGLEAGLEVTVYRSAPDELDRGIRLVTAEPALRYLLTTLVCDLAAFAAVRGDLANGLRCERRPGDLGGESLTLRRLLPRLRANGLAPCAYLASSSGRHGPRWLNCGRAVRHGADGTSHRELPLAPLAGLAPRLLRFATGRYPFFLPRSRLRSRLLSPFVPGRGGEVVDKWFLFQQGPEPDGAGGVVHCAHCPDAVVRGGRLVPVCLADAWRGP